MNSFSRRLERFAELARLVAVARQVERQAPAAPLLHPVLFFNASTRISGLSQNAAFSLLASWAVRLAGVRVVHIVCREGMSRCVLGTNENDLSAPMPCGMCIRQSKAAFAGGSKSWIGYQKDEKLAALLENLSLQELLAFRHPLADDSGDIPLGSLVLPSLRWRLRLHSLTDDKPTRSLCREFMLSAWNIVNHLLVLIELEQPRAAVIFNGLHFPEATVAWILRRRNIRVITHESGFQPFSGYFVEGEATRYPILIPPVDLTSKQEHRLEEDLHKRWKGDFSMAGVRFWEDMHALPQALQEKAAGYHQVAAVFSNVIFDTTQMYANSLFENMFAWLDGLLDVIRRHPETLFVLRAHPDETRQGKASRESVEMWYREKGASLPNLYFIAPQEQVSSYDLIRTSRFVLIYNSTIGLEAILMGVPVLAAGDAPFNAFDTVFCEPSRDEYLNRLEDWLAAPTLDVPEVKQRNTRRFIYYRYYRFSLPFGEFLESTQPTGYVRLKKFALAALRQSATLGVLRDGILHGKRFELDV